MECYKCEKASFAKTKAKEVGIWGLARKTHIGTYGSSLDVKVPKLNVSLGGSGYGQYQNPVKGFV